MKVENFTSVSKWILLDVLTSLSRCEFGAFIEMEIF